MSRTLWGAGFLAPLCLFLRGIQALYGALQTLQLGSLQATALLSSGSGTHPGHLDSSPNAIAVQGPLEPTSILTVYTAAPPHTPQEGK